DRRPVAVGLVVAGLGVGGVAVAEAAGWGPAGLDVADRRSGTLGSPAYLGAAAALLLPPLTGLALDAAWGAPARAAAGVGAAGLAVALVGSGARAAWVGCAVAAVVVAAAHRAEDRKSTRLNSSHVKISYAVFCLKKKKNKQQESK